MENIHASFITTYQATRTQKEKKQLLKTYMLSLSSDDLDSFIFNNLDTLEQKIKEVQLTDTEKQELIDELDGLTSILAENPKRLKAA